MVVEISYNSFVMETKISYKKLSFLKPRFTCSGVVQTTLIHLYRCTPEITLIHLSDSLHQVQLLGSFCDASRFHTESIRVNKNFTGVERISVLCEEKW